MGAYCEDTGVAFVHIPRTGGSSVKKYMAAHLPGTVLPDDAKHRAYAPATNDANLPVGHIALRDWERYVGTDPREYPLILAVRRDPYERALSQWLYWRRIHRERNGHNVAIQHAVATSHPTFTRWLQDPASEHHVRYDYHARQRGEPMGWTDGSYADYGGFYRYWLAVDGEIPANVEVVDIGALGERLPDILAPYGERGEVPRLNEGGPSYQLSEHYTEEAARIVEDRYEWAFGEWYETRKVWRAS